MATEAGHNRKHEFEEVALPLIDSLFNLALKLTRNRKDAEDLVQEAYLRAFRFFDTYEKGTNIKAWMFRILRNTFINRYRAGKRRPEDVDYAKVEETYERIIDEDYLSKRRLPSPEDAVMAGIPDQQIQDAIGRLPEEYRTVVILALVEELSYKEIATVLSVPLGTVMSRLHRGRKILQGALLEYAKKTGIVKGGKALSDSDGEGMDR